MMMMIMMMILMIVIIIITMTCMLSPLISIKVLDYSLTPGSDGLSKRVVQRVMWIWLLSLLFCRSRNDSERLSGR